MGSWKIIEISLPRMARISFSGNVTRSRPRNSIWPDSMRPGGGTRRRRESAVMLLPQPLSPTSPTVTPSGTSNETSSTALSVPVSVRKLVTRFRMRSMTPRL